MFLHHALACNAGPALLGAGYYYKTLLSMNKTTRQAYYFRKNFTAPDASCFYSLFFQLRALDGVVSTPHERSWPQPGSRGKVQLMHCKCTGRRALLCLAAL